MSRVGTSLWRLAAVFTLSMGLLAACSTPATVRIEVTPASTVLNRGGQAQVTVTLTAASAAGPFELTAGTLPAGVTATFSDDDLTGVGDSSEMTLSAEPDATTGAITVTVSAAGAQATGTTSLEVTVQDLDVAGVVKGLLGEPLSGVSVLVEGHAVTTTAADGTFSVADVTVPYDITLFHLGDAWAHRFEGVSTGSLDLVPLPVLNFMSNLPNANVAGDVVPAVPAGHRLTVCAEGVGMYVYGCTDVFTGSSSYDLDVFWREGTDAELRLRAVLYELDAEFDPVALAGSGAVLPFEVTEGGVYSPVLNIGGGPGASASFDVTVVSPIVVQQVIVGAATVLSSGQSFSSLSTVLDGEAATALAPSYAGANFQLVVQAIGAGGQIGAVTVPNLASAGAHTVDVPLPSNIVTPADGALNVETGTDFTITGTPGRVNTFFWSGSAVLAVTTESETTRIPDLAAHGLPLPPAELISWSAINSPDNLDIDEDVQDGGQVRDYLDLVLLAGQAGPAPSDVYRLASAGSRSFTTAP